MTLHKTNDPFDVIGACGRRESIAHGVVIIDALRLVVMASPFRHMTTPGGH